MLQVRLLNASPLWPAPPQVGCFVDLDERSWEDFIGQPRRSVRLADAQKVPSSPGNVSAGKGESSQGRGAASSEEDEEAEEDGDEDDEEFVGGGVKKLGKDETLPVEAFVLDVSPLYEDDRGGELEPAAAATAGDDPAWGVKERIRKMLELGLHADTGEAEAKQAMQNAMRLLTKHNLERADVLRAHGSDASALQGGLKVVELTGRRAAQLTAWMRELSNVAARAFDVSYYTTATATGGGRGGRGGRGQRRRWCSTGSRGTRRARRMRSRRP